MRTFFPLPLGSIDGGGWDPVGFVRRFWVGFFMLVGRLGHCGSFSMVHNYHNASSQRVFSGGCERVLFAWCDAHTSLLIFLI